MKITSENGASAVEFAIVLPLLLVLVFGIIEFSVFLYDKAIITNASREGARAGVVASYHDIDGDGMYEYDPLDVDEIKAVVKDYANDFLLNLGTLNNQVADPTVVYCSDYTNCDENNNNGSSSPVSGDYLFVKVDFRYDFLIFPNLDSLLGGSFDTSITVHGITTMRME